MSNPYKHYINDERLNTSRGLVLNAEVRNIFGYNSSVGTTFRALWEDTDTVDYVFPTANLMMTFTSTDGGDTTQTVLIKGLDSDYNEIQEVVTMNGTVGANTVNEYFRVNDVITASGNLVGTLTVANTGVTYAKIRATEGRNQAAVYTVPAGCTFYLYRIDALSATTTGSQYAIFRNFTTLSSGVELRVAEATFINEMSIHRAFPFKYSQKSDIEFQVKSSASTNEISVFGEGVVIREKIA